MAKYGLFCKGGKEIISIFMTNNNKSLKYNINEQKLAINYFSTIKKLDEDKFLELFDVRKLKSV